MTRSLAAALLLAAACDAAPDEAAAARDALGGEVRAVRALPVDGARWLAALQGPAAGPLQVILLRREGEQWARTGPALPAQDGDGWGVADVDGDGAAAEAWAGRVERGRVEVQAYAPADEALYRLRVPATAAGADAAQREFSFNVMDRPPVQRWLSARADSLARRYLAPGRP